MAITNHKPFEQMSEQEFLAWAESAVQLLKAKKHRELNYLQRRAADQAAGHGKRTGTDRAGEQDQILLADLIAFFEAVIKETKEAETFRNVQEASIS